MKKGIIFDLDGTMWDSAEGVVKAWNEIISKAKDRDHLVTLEEMYGLMGKPMDEIEQLVFPNLQNPRRKELMDLCCVRENEYLLAHGGILYPMLEQTLQTLSEEYELFIVSNCQIGYIEAFLDHYGFAHYFADTENFGNTGKLKAYNISLVVERNKLDWAVYVGDTLGDYNSTMEAGLPFILAEYGFGEVTAAKYRADAFCELPTLVEKVFLETGKK